MDVVFAHTLVSMLSPLAAVVLAVAAVAAIALRPAGSLTNSLEPPIP